MRVQIFDRFLDVVGTMEGTRIWEAHHEKKDAGQHRAEQRRAIWPKKWYNLCMDKQMTLSAFSDELANVRTKKKEFLAQIDRIVPWGEWVAEIKPCYFTRGSAGISPTIWN